VQKLTIPVSLNTNHEITITSDKVITIPAGVVVTVKSLTAEADVTIVGPAGGEAGVIRIKRGFEVKADTEFNLTGNADLAFYPAVTPLTAIVDGTLTVESADSLFWLAIAEIEVEVPRSFGGGGTVQTSSGEEIASVNEQYIPALATSDIFNYGDEDDVEEEEDEPYDEVFQGVSVGSLSLNKGELTLDIGDTAQLTATTDPAGVAVTWRSESPGVASVAADGTVTAKKGGTANIKAKAGGKEDVCEVTVASAAGLYVGGGSENVLGNTEVTLVNAFTWISTNEQNGGEYTIVLGASEEDSTANGYVIGTGTNTSTGSAKTNLKITLKGTSSNITITKTAAGALFTVYGNTESDTPELILEHITLQGYSSNNSALVAVGSGGTKTNSNSTKNGILTMKAGSRITGNNCSVQTSGGGVLVQAGSTFTMMNGARIDNNYGRNVAGPGGGVLIMGKDATFTMNGGTIEDNKVGTGSGNAMGGGVAVGNGATFTLSGGYIKNNIAQAGSNGGGGGVVNANGTFNMEGGVISGNTSKAKAAGVYHTSGTFNKTGGTIYGNGSDAGDNANKALEVEGVTDTVRAIMFGTTWRDTTAGPGVTLHSDNTANWGE
jgi:hypothetical protein